MSHQERADRTGRISKPNEGRRRPPATQAVDPRDITVGALMLPGTLTVPPSPSGVVVFAHGSGSSRHSPRNTFVAQQLAGHRLASLLFDLLTPAEEVDRSNVFDIDLLSSRLRQGVDQLDREPETFGLPVGLFGASTGAAAALVTASELAERVAAVVSRGGRPDLAGPHLATVTAPTLLIVGGADHEVLALNRTAMRSLRCPSQLEIVPGATHLFEEQGALEKVAGLASDWFQQHLFATGVGMKRGRLESDAPFPRFASTETAAALPHSSFPTRVRQMPSHAEPATKMHPVG